MKKIIYLLTMFIIAFSACDPNEEIYDELDNLKEPYHNSVEYTFTADDYATVTEYALANAVTDDDKTYAEFIENMEAFNQFFTAEDYVGYVLAELFPEYNKKSSAKVTYNYVNELPEDLAIYSNATEYTITSSDYESVSFEVGVADYFHPDYPADFYIPEILMDTLSGVSEGDVYKIVYEYAEENPVISDDLATNFTEGFDDGLGQFNGFDILNDEKNWRPSSYEGEFYASMSGFGGGDVEDWLISDPIELDNDASIFFNFTHEINYLNGRWDQLAVAISKNFDGINIETATWDTIDWANVADTANLGSGYDPYNSGDIDISAYANNTIYIAFIYNSSDENAATWHILDVEVNPIKEYYPILYGEKPYEMKDLYKFDGTDWTKLEDTYILNSSDYDAMGDPGDDNMFSGDILPQDYLPKFLNAKYPEAGPGVTKTIIYQYNSDIEGEITLATEYTYGENGWESAYDYIETTTNQFVHNGTEWLFDPTITFTMGKPDYQFIVEYVEDEISADYLDSYGTAEFYYGASYYYNNFSIADGYWEAEQFESWEEAVREAIGDLLLPYKFPDTPAEVNGVDLGYKVIFETYAYGANVNYAMRFNVQKAGPDPIFEYDEEFGCQEIK